jgi:hypothetical protein
MFSNSETQTQTQTHTHITSDCAFGMAWDNRNCVQVSKYDYICLPFDRSGCDLFKWTRAHQNYSDCNKTTAIIKR